MRHPMHERRGSHLEVEFSGYLICDPYVQRHSGDRRMEVHKPRHPDRRISRIVLDKRDLDSKNRQSILPLVFCGVVLVSF